MFKTLLVYKVLQLTHGQLENIGSCIDMHNHASNGLR